MRWLSGLLIVGLMVAGGVAMWSGTAAPSVAAAQPEEATELTGKMEEIDKRVRVLRRTLRSEEHNEMSLNFIAELQGYVLEAKLLEPAKAANIPTGERDAFVAAYRKELATLLIETVNIEIAVLDNDLETAMKIYEKVAAMEEPAHQKFMENPPASE
jgi:hypothetical protein